MTKFSAFILFLIIIIAVGLNGLFTMNEKQQGLVLQFGEPKRVVQDSGLNFKIPLIQNVVRYDKRILEYDLPIEEVIAVDKKRMLIDSFTRFKITDPLEFYKTVGTESNVRNRLNSNVISSLRRVVGRVTLDELLSEDRSKIILSGTGTVHSATVRQCTVHSNYTLRCHVLLRGHTTPPSLILCPRRAATAAARRLAAREGRSLALAAAAEGGEAP